MKSIFVAGERCNLPTLKWLQVISKLPIIDHWWQTESGWGMVSNMMGVKEFLVKMGSATKPVCGFELKILNEIGEEVKANEEGFYLHKITIGTGQFTNALERL